MLHLQAHDIRRQRQTILQGISLTINEGETVALLGASGAGKSTLLDSLRALQPAKTAWCPQHHALVPMLSVFHNIYMGRLAHYSRWKNLRNLIAPEKSEQQQVRTLADTLGLTDKLMTSVDRLSGGEKQRTALGRALYSEQPLLLADEPVSNLDEQQARALLTHALSQHRTAVVALHHRTLALEYCQRVIGLSGGRIILDAPSSSLTLHDLNALYP